MDSVTWETQSARGVLHRVELWWDGQVDTLDGVLVGEPPVVVGDSLVLGFARRNGVIESAFRYRPGKGRTEASALPEDLDPAFSAPAFAPDGRHLAYVAHGGRGRWWPAVLTWPLGEPYLVGAVVEVSDTDHSRNQVHWGDAEHFEIQVDRIHSLVRFRGSVREGFLERDTIHSQREPG